MSREFLLEVGCEEIPARAMGPALDELERRFRALLEEGKLSFDGVETYGTARRLVVRATNLAQAQDTVTTRTLGPPASIAFTDGRPSKALEGFARKSGLGVDQLEVFETERGPYVGFESETGGRPAREILADAVPALIGSLTFPKSMYWNEPGREFARPIRWVVALLGGGVVEMELFGVPAGAATAGHRVLGRPAIPVENFDDYVRKLETNGVIVSQHDRRRKIRRELEAACASLGGRLCPDEGLLEEVVYLNELPSVVAGRFDERFLRLPREVSVTVMREHQKYFAVEGSDGVLLPCFLGVMNTGADPKGWIRKGHERVLEARLRDALFFWDADVRRTLAERVDDLESLTFHRKLGNYREKVRRMGRLAGRVNELTGAGVDADALTAAVAWSKSDLTTDLVGEFADLQGIAGGLYAEREGQPASVWKAIYDQYRPAGLDDRSPETASGAVLALTDRLDTLFGCFSVGLTPRGSADPLALRRDTQGVIKILLDHRLPFSMASAIEFDGRLAGEDSKTFLEFYTDRLRHVLGKRGFAYDEVEAVLATGADDPADVLSRVEAVRAVRESPEMAAIAGAFKRIKNILKQAGAAARTGAVDARDMEPEEAALAERVAALGPRVRELSAAGAYREALGEMAALRPVLESFFEAILVMHADADIRARRLSLLRELSETFLKVADVSEIVVSG